MDKMNLFSIFSTTVIELILSVIIGLIFIRKLDKLNFRNIENIIKVTLFVFIMTIITYYTRLIPIGIVGLLIRIFMCIVAFKLIYSTAWKQSVAAVTFFYSVIITSEVLFLPLFAAFIEKNIQVVFKDDMLRFIYCVPTRLFQIGTLVNVYKHNASLGYLVENRNARNITLTILLLLYLGEFSYIMSIISSIDSKNIIAKIPEIVGSVSLVTLNVFVFKWIRFIGDIIAEHEKILFEKRLKEKDNSMKVAMNFIEKNECDRAINTLRKEV